MQQIVLGAWLITTPDQPAQKNHGVLIENGRITQIAPNNELKEFHPDASIVDLTNCALSPGFIDAHRHCYGVLAHGIPTANAPADFWAFLNEFWWGKIEDRLDHSMLRAAMDVACYDMIRSGITTFFDCLEAPNALPGGLHAQGEVVARWGLRGMLCFEATQRVSQQNGEMGLRENVDFVKATQGEGGRGKGTLPVPPLPLPPSPSLLYGAMCHHTTFTCDDDFIRQAHALAKEHRTLLHFHCSEGTYEPEQCLKKYGHRTIEHYEQLGILDETTMASQCVQLSPREVEIVGQRGIRVTTMPLSNCEVGGGFAPVPEMRQAGATVGLGTDGYVANFFASLRGAFLVHKARLLNPGAMPAHDVWQMATQHGARAMGLDAVTGTLEIGKSADLIAIDLDVPTPITAHNLLDQLILWRDAVDVHSVMVAGKWLKRNYEVLNADPEALIAKTREAAERLWEAL